jgi:hypothetical protein
LPWTNLLAIHISLFLIARSYRGTICAKVSSHPTTQRRATTKPSTPSAPHSSASMPRKPPTTYIEHLMRPLNSILNLSREAVTWCAICPQKPRAPTTHALLDPLCCATRRHRSWIREFPKRERTMLPPILAEAPAAITTPALTTTFTAPAWCATRWHNVISVQAGHAIWSAPRDEKFASCQPTQWQSLISFSHVYSPGICPSGWETVRSGSAVTDGRTVSSAKCCLR